MDELHGLEWETEEHGDIIQPKEALERWEWWSSLWRDSYHMIYLHYRDLYTDKKAAAAVKALKYNT